MALSSPESPAPPRRVFINRVETPSEEHEELNKMAHGVVAESRRYVIQSLQCVLTRFVLGAFFWDYSG